MNLIPYLQATLTSTIKAKRKSAPEPTLTPMMIKFLLSSSVGGVGAVVKILFIVRPVS